ncbi:MAG: thioredoxin domain-containing protein [Zetaproteobacteria bacterium]|nr:MAG: thioredoxin domain-containing protein [Zetaproteobacteria bacterium]
MTRAAQRNALANEVSPYLRQHADHPVQWYPWGEEAFARAARLDRPVLLSIGYSTCHWCHVMAHESFADAEVAELLNRCFVCIKVDREERPDIDALYMRAALRLAGVGGWPLHVVLTPDRRPFYAFTYLPKENRFGRPGLMQVVRRLDQLWRSRREQIERTAAEAVRAIDEGACAAGTWEGEALLQAAYQALARDYDARHGGFGDAPKFPTAHRLMFLLRYGVLQGEQTAIRMVEHTLERMRLGGIHDHLGGGFHRYATDAAWHLPHFEKMLYDQALLLMTYAEAWQVTRRDAFRQTALAIADYMLRDLRHPEGAFFTAEDADSEGREGAYYVWRTDEVRALFGDQADSLIEAFGLREEGNFRDEASHAMSGANVLDLRRPELLDARQWPAMRAHWRQARNRRARPFRDEKVLTDWNGLAVAALALAGRVFQRPHYTEAAASAASFVLRRLHRDGRLLHRYAEGRAEIAATLDDYAFLVWGLLELYASTFRIGWLDAARRLSKRMLRDFAADGGGLFLSAEDAALPVRPIERFDGALPSGNAVAAHNLLRLARITAEHDYEREADRIMERFAGEAARMPGGMSHLLSAILLVQAPARQVVLAGNLAAGEGRRMLRYLQDRFLPNTWVLTPDPSLPYTCGMDGAPDGGAMAYVCTGTACMAPVDSAAQLADMLGGDGHG